MQHEKLMESLIVKGFRGFYEDIVRLKAKALSGDFIATDMENGDDTETPPSTLCKYIQHRILHLLNEQKTYVERYGGEFALRYYQEAQYIMAALADETFINMAWVGREEWKKSLLESQLFHTQVAGEKFFTNLDQFLEVRDSANSDIGVLYIFALGLGFKGRYRDTDDRGSLQKYRDQLEARVMRGSSYATEEIRHIFPEAYAHTIDVREWAKVPTAKKWAIILGGIVLGYVGVSYLMWIMNVGELEVLVNQIVQWMNV